MDFQITALPAEPFVDLFGLDATDLAARQTRRMTVTEYPGVPCRVSLDDAQIGETVILTNFEHQPGDSPYRASHAVYVREGVDQVDLDVNEVPPVIQSRLISLRFFDEEDMIASADVVPGTDVAAALAEGLDDPKIAYVHIHFAKPGCFAATAKRVS